MKDDYPRLVLWKGTFTEPHPISGLRSTPLGTFATEGNEGCLRIGDTCTRGGDGRVPF